MEAIMVLVAAMPQWVTALTTLVTAATAVTILTPTRSDDKVVDFVLKVLNILSGNIGKNTNKDA